LSDIGGLAARKERGKGWGVMLRATVIVATWNRRELLERVLAALGNQTLANTEYQVVVCDSKSSDGTINVIEAAAEKYGNVYYANVSENNPAAKRNEGILRARTDTVILVDDDVIPEPGFVEAHIRAHDAGSGVVFCGQIRYPDEWVKRSNYFRFRDLRHLGPTRRELDPKDIPFRNLVVMNLSFKRSELLPRVGYFSDEFAHCYGGEDYEFGYRIARSDLCIQYLPDAIGYHHEWGGSLRMYFHKLYISSRDTWPVIFRLMPASAHCTKWLYLEQVSADDDRRTRLIKRSIQPFISRRMASGICQVLEYTDGFPYLFWPAAYLYVAAVAHVLGCRDREQAQKTHSDAADG